MHRGDRLKLAEWGRAGLEAAPGDQDEYRGTGRAGARGNRGGRGGRADHLAVPACAGSARLPVGYNGLDGWQHGRARLSVIYVGGSTAFLRIKHWAQWSAASAATRGTLWVDNCRPDCASGDFRTYPAQVSLSRVADRKGVRFFSRMRLRYQHDGPRVYRYRWGTYPGATVPLWVGGPA